MMQAMQASGSASSAARAALPRAVGSPAPAARSRQQKHLRSSTSAVTQLQRLRLPPAARRQRWPCRPAASGGFGQPAAGGGDEAARIPNSREECVEQAAAAIAAQLNVAGSGKTKGFAGAGGRKLTVDVPAQDTSPAGTLQLAQDIVAALPKQLAKQFTVVHCGEGAPPAGGGGGAPVVSLQQCVAQGTDLTGCLLIAAPPASQLDATMRLLAYWRGPAAVVLNAGWSMESLPIEQVAFIKSMEAVYCFLPLMIKVLFIGQDGAVFKWCTGGSPSAAPWRVFGKEGNRLVPIGRMTQRPTNADLEAIFYNAYAANNPLNKGIKSIRGMFGGK